MNEVATHSLHITHGLHLPSCTALTHSRPPLHQSHMVELGSRNKAAGSEVAKSSVMKRQCS